jgi:UTP--glucose-1-phosphate uridylyltransferase
VSEDGLRAAEAKMREAGVADAAIATFRHYYRQLEAGESGMLPDSEIEPIGDVQEHARLPEPDEAGRSALDRTVVIKLNGGLGTSMGMTSAKSLLEVKDGLTFLDIVARQVLGLRRAHRARLPLVLMNSFYTREDSLAALRRHPELASDVPADFLQNKEPKLLAEDLTPVRWPADPDLEWCPPGHGDIYTAMLTSGMLDILREHGYEYAFLSNSDNLGAILDPRILAWFARQGVPYCAEVCDRTEADKKGGHLARRKADGQLVLRETAQTPKADLESFQDTDRWPYFHTNNLWVNLRRLREVLVERRGVLGLPMIVNRKTVDPADSSTPEVIQIETAMGAAVAVFEGARALHVPRSRFAPVKTTNDLLTLRSDAYVLTPDAHVELAPERDGSAPLVELDSAYYKLVRDFDARFPAGPPSLVGAERFTVRGDVRFGRGVVARGTVEVVNDGGEQLVVEDGTLLEGRSAPTAGPPAR